MSDVKQMKTHSNKGNKYIVTFVDRKSRYLRVYFVKRKSDVVAKAKHFLENNNIYIANLIKNKTLSRVGAYPKREVP